MMGRIRVARTSPLWWLCSLLLCAPSSRAHQLTGTDVVTLAQLQVDHRIVAGTYEVQYGELAALEERRRTDADGDGKISAAEQETYVRAMREMLNPNLSLEIDGQPVQVELQEGEVLPEEILVVPEQMTLRYQLTSEPSDFTRRRALVFRDENQLPRLVHADIAIEAMPLVDIDQADPGAGALKRVHVQALEGPVQAAVALNPSEAVWQSGPFAAGQSLLGETPPAEERPPSSTDRLQDMLRSEKLSFGLIVLALVLSIFLGAAHALEPGHGKTIVAAYLIGSRGTVANAIFLGGVVTFTHTFSVILLGLITLFASRYILPEQLFPWLGASSGVLIMGLGVWLFVRNLTGGGHGHSHGPLGNHQHPPEDEHEHDEEHDHDHARDHDHSHNPGHPHEHENTHSHDHGHSHVPQGKVTLGSLLALGISGGIVPCPGALVILLLAVALHRIAFGLLLIIAFSLGLAAVLIAIGILMVKARPLMERFSGEGGFVRRLPLISSVVIIAVGFVMGIRSLTEAGILIINL